MLEPEKKTTVPQIERAALLMVALRVQNFCVLQHLHVFCLPTFRAFDDVESNRLAFFQAAETIRLNGGKVYKHVLTVFPGNKAITLRVIEPLYCSLFHV